MSGKYLRKAICKCVVWPIIFVTFNAAACRADEMPTPDQFAAILNTCAAGSKTEFNSDLVGSVKQLYQGDRTKGTAVFRSESAFLNALPADKKFEGYRLYVECIRSVFSNPAASKRKVQRDLISNYSKDTPLARVIEVFGQPQQTKRWMQDEKKAFKLKNDALFISEFVGDVANIYIVHTQSDYNIAVGVYRKDDSEDAMNTPIPYMHMGNEVSGKILDFSTLHDFKLKYLVELCDDPPQFEDVHARFGFAITHLCYFGRPGGYKNFQFVFMPDYDQCKAKQELNLLEEMQYSKIHCKYFLESKPIFAMVFFDEKFAKEYLTNEIMEWIYHFGD